MEMKIVVMSGLLILSAACTHDRDHQGPGASPPDGNASNQPASKSNAPDTGLGRMGDNSNNGDSGTFGGMH